MKKTNIIALILSILVLLCGCSSNSDPDGVVDLEEQSYTEGDYKVVVIEEGFYMTAGIVGNFHKDKEISDRYVPKPAVMVTYVFYNNSDEPVVPIDIFGAPWARQGDESLTVIGNGYDIIKNYNSFHSEVEPNTNKEITATYLLENTETPIDIRLYETDEDNDDKLIPHILASHEITDEEITFMNNACKMYKPFADEIYKEHLEKGTVPD